MERSNKDLILWVLMRKKGQRSLINIYSNKNLITYPCCKVELGNNRNPYLWFADFPVIGFPYFSKYVFI